jgi:transcriptional regulator of heat shock response
MNTRQHKVLATIVEMYTETAMPVGSHALAERHDFEVSSATLRNDMAELEVEGYLHQPHISSGRIPTDKGYRFYIEEIMGDQELTRDEQRHLQKELLVMKAKQTRLSRTTAKLLSALSGNLAVMGDASKDEFYDFGIKELIEAPEFRDLDELCRMVETLDSLDEKFDVLLANLKDDSTRIFIGEENPIPEISKNCSMMVAPYRNKDGERGVLAIIGPKRMQYAKNKSLLEYVKKLLSGASGSGTALSACIIVKIIM